MQLASPYSTSNTLRYILRRSLNSGITFYLVSVVQYYIYQDLRASSLQFTSPLEFNAIFRDGFPLRVDLNG